MTKCKQLIHKVLLCGRTDVFVSQHNSPAGIGQHKGGIVGVGRAGIFPHPKKSPVVYFHGAGK